MDDQYIEECIQCTELQQLKPSRAGVWVPTLDEIISLALGDDPYKQIDELLKFFIFLSWKKAPYDKTLSHWLLLYWIDNNKISEHNKTLDYAQDNT